MLGGARGTMRGVKFLRVGVFVLLGVVGLASLARAEMRLFRLPAVDGKRPAYVLADEVGATTQGLTVLKLRENFVYVDATGRVVIPTRGAAGFDEARPFGANGLAAVRLGRKFGYVNRAGEFVVPLKYDEAEDFVDSAFALVSAGGKWGVLGADGRELIPVIYDGVQSFYGEGFSVFDGTARAMTDRDGKLLSPFHFQYLGNQHGYGFEGLVPAQRDGRWGFAVIATGQVAVPLIYDEVGRFSEGFANFSLNGKVGYVDRAGRVLVEPKFEDADEFSEGLAAVRLDGRWGYLDREGRLAIAPAYDAAYKFDGEFASVQRGEEWLRINRKGELSPRPPYVPPPDVAPSPSPEPELVTTPQRCTVRFDHLNLGMDLKWDGKDRASEVRVFTLDADRTLAWDARLTKGIVHDGLFLVDGKIVIFGSRQGFTLDAWDRQIATALRKRQEQFAAIPAAVSNAARAELVTALKAISADIDEVDKLAPTLATLRFEFDIDASTPVEAAANRIKKARAYVDRVKALTTKIDRAFAELPILNAEQRELLDGIRRRDAASVQELLDLK